MKVITGAGMTLSGSCFRMNTKKNRYIPRKIYAATFVHAHMPRSFSNMIGHGDKITMEHKEIEYGGVEWRYTPYNFQLLNKNIVPDLQG